MSLEALNYPAAPPHRRFDGYAYDSSRKSKRSRIVSDDEYLAGCLVALRSGGDASSSAARSAAPAARIYNCSVCGKGFPSHQALGGHKASHRIRPAAAEERKPADSASTASTDDQAVAGPHRLHKCSTCGRSFPSGQALGGHMRKHYGGVIGGSKSGGVNSSDGGNGDGFSVVTSSSYGDGDGDGDVTRNLDLNLLSEEGLDLTLRL